MNILFLTEKYPPIVCAGNRVYNLVKQLSKEHNITVMARKNNRWLFPMPLDHNIEQITNVKLLPFRIYDNLLLFPTMFLFKINLISNSKFYFNQLKRTIKKNEKIISKIDLVITSGPSWDSFKGAEYIYDKFNIPFILDYRDPWNSKTKKELLTQKRIINKAKHVVTVTDDLVLTIKKITNFKKVINVVKNGVELKSIKKIKTKKDNKLRIGFAGNFVKYHNVDVLIKAISILPKDIKKNIVFEGCGGPFQKPYEKLAKKLDVNANFYGHLPLNDMNNVLQTCDLFYLGTLINNAISGKFYTYLALNKPLLCFTKKKSKLDLEINKNKLGFCDYDIESLSKSIENLYLNKKLLDENNFEIESYIKNYDWEVLAKKYNEIIKNTK